MLVQKSGGHGRRLTLIYIVIHERGHVMTLVRNFFLIALVIKWFTDVPPVEQTNSTVPVFSEIVEIGNNDIELEHEQSLLSDLLSQNVSHNPQDDTVERLF